MTLHYHDLPWKIPRRDDVSERKMQEEKVTHLITQLSDKVESLIVENPSTLKRKVASLLASSSSSAPSSQPSTSASSGACCGCGSTCLCACIIIKNSFYNLRWIMSFGHISRNNTLAYTFGAPTWTIINKFWRTITRLPPTHPPGYPLPSPAPARRLLGPVPQPGGNESSVLIL